jgi:hypothetical protein
MNYYKKAYFKTTRRRTGQNQNLASYGVFSGALGRTRTCDLLVSRLNRTVLCGSARCNKDDSQAFLVSGYPGLPWKRFPQKDLWPGEV